MKKQKQRQAKYANRGATNIQYEVGDPVFLRNHKRENKLAPSWQPYYRIIEQTAPLNFRIKNQLTGEVIASHAEHLVLAKTDWDLADQPPSTVGSRRSRRRQNVVSEEDSSIPESSSDETEVISVNPDIPVVDSDHESQVVHPGTLSHTSHDSQPEILSDNLTTPVEEVSMSVDFSPSHSESADATLRDKAFHKLSQPYRNVRDGSSSEDDIPLAELSRRLKQRRSWLDEVRAIRQLVQNAMSIEKR